jgi:hypothetical protein
MHGLHSGMSIPVLGGSDCHSRRNVRHPMENYGFPSSTPLTLSLDLAPFFSYCDGSFSFTSAPLTRPPSSLPSTMTNTTSGTTCHRAVKKETVWPTRLNCATTMSVMQYPIVCQPFAIFYGNFTLINHLRKIQTSIDSLFGKVTGLVVTAWTVYESHCNIRFKVRFLPGY